MTIQKTNPKVLPRRKSIFGFTLVELIVVITILAILGTIGFLSIGGYSSKARDSARISDVASISKSLDLSIVTVGSYPTPDRFFSITYSWGVIWNQGVVGSNVLQAMRSSISGGGLSKIPTDPLSNSQYTYSSLAYGKAYQIKVNYEGDLNQTAMILPSVTSSLGGLTSNLTSSLTSNLIPEALAAPGSPTIAYIRGNYGGITAKTVTGGITYILAVPSIITASGAVWVPMKTENDALSGSLLFNGKNLVNASSFNPKTVVYSGTGSPTGAALIANLQNAYSGATDIKSNSSIATVLSTTGATAIENLGNSIVMGQLGGESKQAAIEDSCLGNWCTVSEPEISDPKWNKVSLLMSMDGANDSTTFLDTSSVPKTIATIWLPKISTVQSKFGWASGLFNGSSCLKIPYSADFDLSGDFTIETWFRSNSFAVGQTIISKDTYGSNFDWNIGLNNATTINIHTSGTSQNLTVTVPAMSTGQWYHVAITRAGTTNTIYLNGVSYGSNTMGISNSSQANFTIGCSSWNNPGGFFNGNIDELRVTKWAARYTANFTVPTSAFPIQE